MPKATQTEGFSADFLSVLTIFAFFHAKSTRCCDPNIQQPINMVYYTHTGKAIYAVRKEGEGMTGRIHSYETLGAADGPGLRFVLFLQGCGLRCLYCHNPDTWNPCGGRTVSAEEIVREVVRYRNYFGRRGGFTASGGEPLLQPDFLCELFGRLKAEGISTALDTSGAPYRAEDSRYDALLRVTDLVLLDIKHIDDDVCRRLTGHGNAATVAFAERLSREGIPMWIRQVLVPGWTDRETDLQKTRQWIDSLSSVERVEVLPYHTLGKSKYEALQLPYPLGSTPTPDAEAVKRAEKILIGDPGCTTASRKRRTYEQ